MTGFAFPFAVKIVRHDVNEVHVTGKRAKEKFDFNNFGRNAGVS